MKKIRFLSGNMLKVIAAITMTVDHIGVIFFPSSNILRIIGRISFPIFAFMIAEGCKYTKNKFRYFNTITIFGLLFQVVFYHFTKMEYGNIFITFALSILMIYALEGFQKRIYDSKYTNFSCLISALFLIGSVVMTYFLNQRFEIDYGFYGSLVPVFASLFVARSNETPKLIRVLDNNFIHVLMLGLGLYLEYISYGWLQLYSLLALPLLLLYSGKRGQKNMKNFFYLFYPIHLVVLYGIAMVINML